MVCAIGLKQRGGGHVPGLEMSRPEGHGWERGPKNRRGRKGSSGQPRQGPHDRSSLPPPSGHRESSVADVTSAKKSP